MTEAPILRASSVPPESASRHFDPVLRPDLAELYLARATRLRDLAEGHDLAEYLRLAALVAEGQAASLDPPAETDEPGPRAIAAGEEWLEALRRILGHIAPDVPEAVYDHIEALADAPDDVLQQAGLALVEGRFDDVDAAAGPFLWAALSLVVAQAARIAPLPPRGDEETSHCPICGTAPVASLIHTGDRQGMRYLHCALCECDWHMVRAKCSNCGDAAELDYLSFDTPEAAIRAEACGACGSYLKVINQEREPAAEAVADDLASLLLDDAAGAEGYGRSGFNPFALPGRAPE